MSGTLSQIFQLLVTSDVWKVGFCFYVLVDFHAPHPFDYQIASPHALELLPLWHSFEHNSHDFLFSASLALTQEPSASARKTGTDKTKAKISREIFQTELPIAQITAFSLPEFFSL